MTTLGVARSGSQTRAGLWSSVVLLAATGLIALGVVMVFSARGSTEPVELTWRFWKHRELRQLAFGLAAVGVMLAAASVPYRWLLPSRRLWQWWGFWLTVLAVGTLAAVLVPGIGAARHGSRRWLAIGPAGLGIGFQPSELAKLAMVVWLAGIIGSGRLDLRSFWRGLLPALIVPGLFVGLIGIEDFGTAVLLLVVAGLVLLACGARGWHMGLLVAPAAAAVTYLLVSKPYRLDRLKKWWNLWEHADDETYQQVQSLLAIFSGGLFGRGLGNSLAKFQHLPEARSDFIFAIICEELGMLGGAGVVALYGALVAATLATVRRCPDRFAQVAALGCGLTLGLQAVLNVAVVTASVPPKGIALPLVSAGGTGLLILAALVGLLANMARRAETSPADDTEEH